MKAKYDSAWFGKGQCVLIVEKIHKPDGSSFKRVIKQDKPTCKYYVTAPDYRDAHSIAELSYPIEKCDEYESELHQLDKHIAELTDQMDYYNETKGPGANRRRRKLHDHRWVHGSDIDVSDAYIDRYMQSRGDQLDTTTPLEMAFSDIEVDGVDHVGFPEEDLAPCPISIITYFHEPSKTCTWFALRNLVRENPQIAEFEANLEEISIEFLAELNRGILENTGNKEKGIAPLIPKGCEWQLIANQLGLLNDGEYADEDTINAARLYDVKFNFFDEELDLIKAYLHTINEIDRPDIVSFWNMKFDIVTIMNRIRILGEDPEELFTPKDFKQWISADYRADTFKSHPTEKSDIFICTSYSIYIDAMLNYAQLRKHLPKKESYTLDFILSEDIKEHKAELKHSIKDAIYKDYKMFMLYAGQDVVPMATLEKKTEDIATAYQLSMITRTRIHKVMKKTICLRNFANVYYRNKGLVLSNNRNKNKERTDTEKFRGAYVADPNLMGYSGILIEGNPSNRVFDNAADFDATALYPSILITFAIDAAGQIGRIIIFDENGQEIDSSILMEAWASGNTLAIGKVWLNLPSIEELQKAVFGGE
jgi:hypothetical protein